jgi:hypothetical protein
MTFLGGDSNGEIKRFFADGDCSRNEKKKYGKTRGDEKEEVRGKKRS